MRHLKNSSTVQLPGRRYRTAFRWLLSTLFVVNLLAACSDPPDLVGIDNPDTPVGSVPDVSRHKIFIATTRQASEVVGAFYSDRRAPELGLASVDVSIPPNHQKGKLERPRSLPPNPLTQFAVVDPTIYQTDSAFVASLNRELAKRPPGSREILFFVHGYNNSTSDAILRLAQFVEDTEFKGIPLLFTWASAGRTSRYVYDLNSALVARSKLSEVASIAARTNADGYTVLAHSMGAFLTMEGIVRADLAGRLDRSGRLDRVVLASPDIDLDLFREQMTGLHHKIDNFYVFVSKDDGALRISRRIAGGVPRLGTANAEELAKMGVIVFDLSEIHDSNSGSHSKFAGSPEVVQFLATGLAEYPGFAAGPSTQLDQLLAEIPVRVVVE